MNAFGIDTQRTTTVITLREGRGAAAMLRSVGDGQRALIPNAARGTTAWGSGALQRNADCFHAGTDALRDSAWTDEPGAAIFWRGIAARLHAYLGRLRPTRENGYELVVSHVGPASGAREGLEALCRGAGLADLTFIPGPHALLCRWLLGEGMLVEGDQAVAAVTVGDTSIEVAGYAVRRERGAEPRVIGWNGRVHRIETGQAEWAERLLQQLREQLSEPPAEGLDPAVRMHALEFGARLGRAGSETLQWTGPLHDRMYEPLRLSPADCREWEGVRRLKGLPALLEAVTEGASSRARPDVVLIGGVGSLWPFVREVVGPEQLWQSGSCQEDVARGAAWWPELPEASREVLLTDTVLEGLFPALPDGAPSDQNGAAAGSPHIEVVPSPTASVEPPLLLGSDDDVVPPWKQ